MTLAAELWSEAASSQGVLATGHSKEQTLPRTLRKKLSVILAHRTQFGLLAFRAGRAAILSLHVSGNMSEFLDNFSSLRPPLSSSTACSVSRRVCLLRRAVELLVLLPGISPWASGSLPLPE